MQKKGSNQTEEDDLINDRHLHHKEDTCFMKMMLVGRSRIFSFALLCVPTSSYTHRSALYLLRECAMRVEDKLTVSC